MDSKIDLKHADCLELLPSVEPNSIPLIVADPPYGIGYHSNHYKGKNPHAPVANDWNFQPGRFFSAAERVLKDGGAMYVFCRWDVLPLWIPYINGAGLKLKTVIAWVKDNHSAGDLEGCFGNRWESILFLAKGKHKLRGNRWSNVWEFPRVSHRTMVHPTQKPVALLERAIASSSDPGDLVLDCYAGSGSTGEAARQIGRSSLLIDVDPKMIAIAAARLGIESFTALPMLDPEPPPPTTLELPNPADWGIHPEELVSIRDALQGNLVAGRWTLGGTS